MRSNKPPVVHLLDQRRKPSPGRFPVVCGGFYPHAQVATMGWKVTCTICNPPGRRVVRRKNGPAPAPTKKDLETA